MRPILIRITMLAVACIVSVGSSACGSSDSGNDESAQKQRPTKTPSLAATRAGTDEEQITATLHYAGNAFAKGDGATFCAKLSADGRTQYVSALRAWGRHGTCAEILAQGTAINRRAGRRLPPVTVSSIKVNGDKATAYSRGAVAGQSGLTLGLIKEDGEWRLSDIGVGGPTAQYQDRRANAAP